LKTETDGTRAGREIPSLVPIALQNIGPLAVLQGGPRGDPPIALREFDKRRGLLVIWRVDHWLPHWHYWHL
jgi:hypothetical protein